MLTAAHDDDAPPVRAAVVESYVDLLRRSDAETREAAGEAAYRLIGGALAADEDALARRAATALVLAGDAELFTAVGPHVDPLDAAVVRLRGAVEALGAHRRHVAHFLGLLVSPAAGRLLVEMLDDASPAVRHAALDALAGLARELRSTIRREGRTFWQNLFDFGAIFVDDSPLTDTQRRLFEDWAERVRPHLAASGWSAYRLRAAAARALRAIGVFTPETTDDLWALTEKPDSTAGRLALQALVRDPRTEPGRVIELLGRRPALSSSDVELWVSMEVARELREDTRGPGSPAPSRPTSDRLLEWLAQERPAQVEWAARTLAAAPTTELAPALRACLRRRRDARGRLSWLALRFLRGVRGDDTVATATDNTLIWALRKDESDATWALLWQTARDHRTPAATRRHALLAMVTVDRERALAAVAEAPPAARRGLGIVSGDDLEAATLAACHAVVAAHGDGDDDASPSWSRLARLWERSHRRGEWPPGLPR